MNIREAEEKDAYAIHDLYIEVMGYEYPIEQMKKMIQVVHKDNNNYVFVAVDQGHVRGVIEVVIKYSIHKPSYLIINTLAVSQNEQGKGIGSQLLAYIETFAKEHKLGSISVGSQYKRLDTHRFYQKNAFTQIKEHKIFEKKI